MSAPVRLRFLGLRRARSGSCDRFYEGFFTIDLMDEDHNRYTAFLNHEDLVILLRQAALALPNPTD